MKKLMCNISQFLGMGESDVVEKNNWLELSQKQHDQILGKIDDLVLVTNVGLKALYIVLGVIFLTGLVALGTGIVALIIVLNR